LASRAALLNGFARVPVCGLIAQYSGAGQSAGPNLLSATTREVLSKSLTLRGFNYEFAAEHNPTFLRTVRVDVDIGESHDPQGESGMARHGSRRHLPAGEPQDRRALGRDLTGPETAANPNTMF
jgi:hypothetical protein